LTEWCSIPNTTEATVELNTDNLLHAALADAIRDGVRKVLVDGYHSPLTKFITDAIESHKAEMRKVLEEGVASCLNDGQFREQLKTAVRQALAKTLVQRFGGELEKQVNVLKSDPTTRARIILALEEIVSKAG
jgi:hypothetical protein